MTIIKGPFSKKKLLPSLKIKNNLIAVEIHVDSCGNSGQSETPQNKTVLGVRGGSLVARGKRSVF
jgi:hypothetical protein